MRGKNPIRKPVEGDGSVLEIQEIFPTLQGEGPLVGTPAVFIRLGGCNLNCSFCDTKFEDFTPWSMAQIMSDVKKFANNNQSKRARKLVVITGGEPFRQPIELLCSTLLDEGFDVQVETNGTLFRPIDERVQLVVSPKNKGKGYRPVRDDLLKQAIAVKFIISKHDPDYQGVSDVGQNLYNLPVYIQPMDMEDKKLNEENLEHTLDLCEKYGYRLSQQMHKIWGMK